MVVNLELLHEGFRNELDELDSLYQNAEDFVLKKKQSVFINKMHTITSNLEGLCDSLYNAFEEDNSHEIEELKTQNEAMKFLLSNMLSHDDKVYMRLKYGIEIN